MTAGEIIEYIREILWLDTDEKTGKPYMNPDKEWDEETIEDIARFLSNQGLGAKKTRTTEEKL